MTLKTRVTKLEIELFGHRTACILVPEGAEFWVVAQQVIDAGIEPASLSEILRNIEGTSRGLPSEEERDQLRSGKRDEDTLALVRLQPGEIFKTAVQRLKFNGEMPGILGG